MNVQKTLVETVEAAVPILVDSTLNRLATVLDAEQKQRVKFQVIDQAKNVLSASVAGVNFDSIPFANLQEDLQFMVSNSALHPDLENGFKFVQPYGWLQEDSLRKEDRWGGQAAQKISKPLYQVLQQVSKFLYAETQVLTGAERFATTQVNPIRNQALVLSESRGITFKQDERENQNDFDRRRIGTLRNEILEIALTRLAFTARRLPDTVVNNARADLQQQFALSHPVYLSTGTSNSDLVGQAAAEAEQYLQNLGFESQAIQQSLSELVLTEGREAFLAVAIGAFTDDKGSAEIFDPKFLEVDQSQLQRGGKLLKHGWLSDFDKIFDTDYNWKRLESGEKQRRTKAYLDTAFVSFDVWSYISETTKSQFRKRFESSGLFTRGESIYFDFKISDVLTASQMQEISEIDSSNLDSVWNNIILQIGKSEVMRKKTMDMNAFLANQVREIAADPQLFLDKVGINNVSAKDLLPIDWCNVLVNTIVGKFRLGTKSTVTPAAMWDPLAKLTMKDLDQVAQFAISL